MTVTVIDNECMGPTAAPIDLQWPLKNYQWLWRTVAAAHAVAAVCRTILPMLAVLWFDHAMPTGDIGLLFRAGALATLLLAVESALVFYTGYASYVLGQRLDLPFASRLFEAWMRAEGRRRAHWSLGEMSVRTFDDTATAARGVVLSRTLMPVEAARLLLIIALVSWLDPWAGCFGVLVAALTFWSNHWVSREYAAQVAERQARDSELRALWTERAQIVDLVQAFQRQEIEVERFSAAWRARGRLGRVLKLTQDLSSLAGTTVPSLMRVAGLMLIGWQVVRGQITLGAATAIAVYLPMVEDPVRRLISASTDLSNGGVAASRLSGALEALEAVGGATVGQSPRRTWGDDVVFKQVRLRFDGESTPGLEDVDLVIAPGEAVAVIGESGAGKTSLLKLILGLLEPEGGSLQSPRPDATAVVLQDFQTFAGTVRENLVYGTPQASEQDLLEVAHLTGVHADILALTGGYDARVQAFGGNLSSGLRAKLALTRALLRRPSILVLDETTRDLGPEGELLVREVLERCRGRVSVVMVAHRVSSVQGFERIVVLERGRVVEQGTPAQLLALQGRYYRMSVLQMGGLPEFQSRLRLELERAQRYNNDFSLLYVEVGEEAALEREFADEGAAALARYKTRAIELELQLRKDLRTMDFAAGYQLRKYIVGLPETRQQNAEIVRDRLIAHLGGAEAVRIGIAEYRGRVAPAERGVAETWWSLWERAKQDAEARRREKNATGMGSQSSHSMGRRSGAR